MAIIIIADSPQTLTQNLLADPPDTNERNNNEDNSTTVASDTSTVDSGPQWDVCNPLYSGEQQPDTVLASNSLTAGEPEAIYTSVRSDIRVNVVPYVH